MFERLSGLFARSASPHAAKTTPLAPAVRSGDATPRRLAEWHDPEEHAVALIEWARTKGLEGSVLATDLKHLHEQMCRELGWLPRRSNPVARAIALRTTDGRKVYVHLDGRRLRIYPLHWTSVRDPPSA